MSLILFMRQIRDSTSLLSSTRCSWTWPMLHAYVRLSLRRLYMQTVKRFFTWIDLQLTGTHAGRNDWSYRRNFSVSSSTITGFLFAGIENRTPAAATPYSEITQLVIMDETLVSWCFNHNPTKHGKTRRTRWQTDRLKSRDDNNANAARGITNGGKLDENENETTKHNLTKWRNLSFFPFLSHTFI